MNERIIFAAILRTDNCIVFGRDHADCIKRSPKGTCKGDRLQQGFLTDKFRFIRRKEAAIIAYQAEQIDKIEPDQVLISEELWCPQSGGKFAYDEKLGYQKRPDRR
ncbi:hypothetical protein LCGC14_1365730 [marine sediment metagenome]|uniref:Uncharacterized protein n=1 Tax=marine sediment metagenome TaxID=412755 RepID=A0A0F9K7C5_9ZZZZ